MMGNKKYLLVILFFGIALASGRRTAPGAFGHSHDNIMSPVAVAVEKSAASRVQHSSVFQRRGHAVHHARAYSAPTVGLEVEYSAVKIVAMDLVGGDNPSATSLRPPDGFSVYETPGVNVIGLPRLKIEMDNVDKDLIGEYAGCSELVIQPFAVGDADLHGQAQIALSLWAQAAYHVGQMPVTTWTNPGPNQDADFTAVYNAWPVLIHAPTVRRDIRPLRAVVEVFSKMLIGQSDYPGKSNAQEMHAFIPEMTTAARQGTGLNPTGKMVYVMICRDYAGSTVQVNVGVPLPLIADANFQRWLTSAYPIQGGNRKCSARERMTYIQAAVTAWIGARAAALNGQATPAFIRDALNVKSTLELFVWQCILKELGQAGATEWKNYYYILPKARIRDAVVSLSNSAALQALQTALTNNDQAGAQLKAQVLASFNTLRNQHVIDVEAAAIDAANTITSCLGVLFAANPNEDALGNCGAITPPTRPLPVTPAANPGDDLGIVVEFRTGVRNEDLTWMLKPKTSFVPADLNTVHVQGIDVEVLNDGRWKNPATGLAEIVRVQTLGVPTSPIADVNR